MRSRLQPLPPGHFAARPFGDLLMPLNSLDTALLKQIALVLGDPSLSQQQIDDQIKMLVPDPELAQRAKEWSRETFGWVLISQVEALTPPQTFHAKTQGGEWKEFPLEAEPLFADAARLALDLLGEGHRSVFETLATRSALFDGVNKMLNAGADLTGAVISGPAFVTLRADIYE